jgi:LruC domain-containing protein
MRGARGRRSVGSAWAAGAILLLLPWAAWAQDADGDGVPDATDEFPCDGTRASVSFFPTETSSALLAFEDQWPGATDLDFNDVALRVNYRVERDAAGNAVRVVMLIDPMALGGDHSNGLGLKLPVDKAGVTARRALEGGGWETLTPEVDGQVTLVLSPNLRELYNGATGRINSTAGATRLNGLRLQVELTFATPAALPQAAAPWDVFIFRAATAAPNRHEIHLPAYSGTAAMNPLLLNSAQDASTATRKFVHLSGVPAALNLFTSTSYPLEGVAVSALFPDIAGFASSGGAQNADFYSSSVVGAQGHTVTMPAILSLGRGDTTCAVSLLPPPGSLVGYWDFEQTGSIQDQSGNNNHGFANPQAVQTTAGKIGKAYVFSANACIGIPDSASLRLPLSSSGRLTMMAWIKYGGTCSNDRGIILNKENSYEMGIACDASRFYQEAIQISGQPWFWSGAAAVTTDVWTLVATTWDGSTVRQYINGALVGTRSLSGTLISSDLGLGIGCRGVGTTGNAVTSSSFFNGTIDEVSLYNRSLSPSEIQAYYDATR